MTRRGATIVLLALVAALLAGATVALAAARRPEHPAERCHATAHHRCAAAPRRQPRRTSKPKAKPRAKATPKPRAKPMPMPVTSATTTTTAATSGPGTATPTSGTQTNETMPPPALTTTTTTAAASTSGPARLQVTAREYSFTLSRDTVPAGPIIIELVNAGQDAHNLHIAPADGGADVAVFPLTQPGTHEDLQFTLAAGSYTLYCSLPGHEAMGMMATLTAD